MRRDISLDTFVNRHRSDTCARSASLRVRTLECCHLPPFVRSDRRGRTSQCGRTRLASLDREGQPLCDRKGAKISRDHCESPPLRRRVQAGRSKKMSDRIQLDRRVTIRANALCPCVSDGPEVLTDLSGEERRISSSVRFGSGSEGDADRSHQPRRERCTSALRFRVDHSLAAVAAAGRILSERLQEKVFVHYRQIFVTGSRHLRKVRSWTSRVLSVQGRTEIARLPTRSSRCPNLRWLARL